MLNFLIYEDGNGGQLSLTNNDIQHTRSLATLAYLNMFAGSTQANTVRDNPDGALRQDWWGNDSNLSSDTWINSNTERTLRGISLTSANISVIQQAVEKDNENLEQYGTVSVSVTYPDINRVKIVVQIKEPDKQNATTLAIIWDSTKTEVIRRNII